MNHQLAKALCLYAVVHKNRTLHNRW